MSKIDKSFVKAQYESGVENYRKATLELGLWKSEKDQIKSYCEFDDRILDLGCGTGRTTFGLHQIGFRSVVGVDFTEGMIATARDISIEKALDIEFHVGDATQLDFADTAFDCVIFSFNGFFSIPGHGGRDAAFREIHRVLKNGAYFIFTSHDRDNPEFLSFWKEEKGRWEAGAQDEALHDFGDIIAVSQNETVPIYIHIPHISEVREKLRLFGFKVKDTFMRDNRYKETPYLLKYSNDCRFWIAQKVC